MFLAKVETEMFRGLQNFSCTLSPGLNVMLGENNVGKSTLLDAIRLPLASGSGPREIWGKPSDISHDDSGKRLSDQFQIHLTFRGLTPQQTGLFSECLSPSLGSDVAQIHYRLRLEPDGAGGEKRVVKIWGGEVEGRLSFEVLDNIRLVFLPALRDAEADLKPGKTSRIARLLSEVSQTDAERTQLEQIVQSTNMTIKAHPLIDRAIRVVNDNLSAITGTPLAQKVDIALANADFDRIAGSMRALIGTGTAFEIDENGLGYNNLLYIAAVLAELRRARTRERPVIDHAMLLVEEPEAHLHPQLQVLLASFLCKEASDGAVQVLLTSHSQGLAAHVPGESITILHRGKTKPNKGKILAKALSDCGLDVSALSDIRRYLDATKSTLFFARGVVLVEGIAETFLLPELAKQIGVNLDELGVSVVNLSGLTFGTFAQLFGSGNIEIPCAVVTDADPTLNKAEKEARDKGTLSAAQAEAIEFPTSLGRMSATATKLIANKSGMVDVFLACKTLEWDLALEPGNALAMAETYAQIRPELGKTMCATINQGMTGVPAARVFFDGLNPKDKGRFAQRLAARLESCEIVLQVPGYLRRALEFVAHGVKDS